MNSEESRQAKQEATDLYQAWVRNKGVETRPQQLEMIHQIVDALTGSDNRTMLLEAGTGIGKTIAYLCAVMSVATNSTPPKKVVVVTNTVALQDQMIKGELPELHRLREFNYDAAKGRERYACTYRIDQVARGAGERLRFSGGDQFESKCNKALSQLESREWDGDMDRPPVRFSSEERRRVTTNSTGCFHHRCKYFRECPYYARRWPLLDVVVTNYNLFLLDIKNDGGILPNPTDTIYVLDEAHNFRDKVMQAFEISASLLSISELTKSSVDIFKGFYRYWTALDPLNLDPTLRSVANVLPERVSEIEETIQQSQESLPVLSKQLTQLKFDSSLIHRLALGIVPEKLVKCLSQLENRLKVVEKYLAAVSDFVYNATINQSDSRNTWASENLELVRETSKQCRDYLDLISEWCVKDQEGTTARWVKKEEPSGESPYFKLFSVPILVDQLLNENIWNRCSGAVCVSATLGGFDDFKTMKTEFGLSDQTSTLSLPSPFDPNRVRLHIPRMKNEAGNQKYYTRELAKLIPQWFKEDISGLVLFASREYMTETWNALQATFKKKCLMQSLGGTDELLSIHRHRVSNQRPSFIFGLSTFREGMDLPGDLCRHVVIARLPFPVPQEPVLQARKERMFREDPTSYFAWQYFDLFETTLRIQQACGRLIRHEEDFGTITIADNRLRGDIGKRYRHTVLQALPYEVVEK